MAKLILDGTTLDDETTALVNDGAGFEPRYV